MSSRGLLPTYSLDAKQFPGALEYPPLHDSRAIRILHLRPGQIKDSIVCTLQVCSLHEHPPYHTLSYTWGDLNDVVLINCDNAILRVTKNLDIALRHIRQPRSPICLWIDAICINQDDIDERNCQVRIMKEVYAAADETICWLGEGDEDSNVAIDLIARMADVVKIPGPGGALTFNNVLAFPPPVDIRNWDILSNFYFRRSWSRRVWVRQEIAVSKILTIMCGKKTLDWDTFSQVTIWQRTGLSGRAL